MSFKTAATVIFILLFAIKANSQNSSKPNIIFILSDDVGYSVPTVNNGNSFYTPNIDFMARHGMNFSHCEGTPLCNTSRIMLLTGKYNFRNYSNWGYMNSDEKTFGNVMRDAGYATGFFGKLQLQFQYAWMDAWGFDKYTVFDITEDTIPMRRYKSPVLIDNYGRVPAALVKDKYCDDILTDRICNFIDSNLNKPFMVYYSMSIGHEPFNPTPDDAEYASWDPGNNVSDSGFYPSMINYMDKKIGVLLNKLHATGLDKNTIVIFTGDNGVPTSIRYNANGEKNIHGEKGRSTEGGTHVPLMVYWPGHTPEGSTNDDLIDFSDFLPTFAEAGQLNNLNNYGTLDGISFYKKLLGLKDTAKQQLFLHFDPLPGFDTLKRWVRNITYKLYDNSGKFYNIAKDVEEKKALKIESLTPEELAVMQNFRTILDTGGTWPQAPVINNPFFLNVTNTSAEIGGTIVSEGASALIDRGSTLALPKQNEPFLSNDRINDSVAVIGSFKELRNNLLSQTKYRFSVYAMNKNAGHSTSFAFDSFYTLSNPPILQPSTFKATINNCFVLLQWENARFPNKGASQAGYIVVYSSGIPELIDNANGNPPFKIIKTGSLAKSDVSALPGLPDPSIKIYNLSKDTIYHFSLIPYTWDGFSDSTYNYLLKDALTVSVQPLHSFLSLKYTSTDLQCFEDSSGSITANASQGTMPYTYSFNNGPYNNTSVFTNLPVGNYLIAARDSNNCITKENIILKQPSKLKTSAFTVDPACNSDNTGIINTKASGGLFPYQYNINGSVYDSDSVFTNLPAGDYLIAARDSKNCITTQNIILKQPSKLKASASATDPACYSDNTGSINIKAYGGLFPYQYNINGSAYDNNAVFTNLSAGDYLIAARDSNNCITTQSIILKQPSKLTTSASATDIACNSGNTGIINIKASGGLFPYQYNINGSVYNSNSVFANLPAGDYLIAARDNNNCITTQNIILKQPSKLTASASVTDPACYSDNTGNINIKASGGLFPYQYNINGSAYDSNAVFTNLSAGNYLIVAKDLNGCSDTSSIILQQPSQINLLIKTQNESCSGRSDGFISVEAQNGTEPFVYSLNDSDFINASRFKNLSAGNYSIKVKDNKGCISSKSVRISSNYSSCIFGITVTPNPTQSKFYVNIGNDLFNKNIFIKVVNSNGQTILAFKGINKSQYSFGNTLAKGIYFIVVASDNNTYTFKVIKQ